MNRKKLNAYSKSSDDSHWEYNDLYRRFHQEFDFILNAQTAKPDVINGCYVKNTDIEERLDLTLYSKIDSIQFLIGRTGIGKSTILRHKFKTFRDPLINDKTLIIPFSFDSMRIYENDCDKKLSGIIVGATSILVEKYGLEFDKNNFVEFIKSHARDVLYRGTTNEKATNEELLKILEETERYTYTIEKLKYYIYNSKITKLIILVDDIESEKYLVQELIIDDMCHLYECMTNFKGKKVAINLIFSVRPITEKLIRKNKGIQAFPLGKPIIIKKPISLNELFKAKMNSAIDEVGTEHIKNKESWSEALEILIKIVELISDEYGNGMLNLFNNNIRGALSAFQKLITNRFWLQKNSRMQASYKIDESDYSINRASVYRALGMRNGKIYPATGTCIANIFWNTSEKKYDLLIVYIIKYFIELNKGTDFLDQIATYSDILDTFKHIFCIDGFPETIDKVLERMEEVKLIEIETNGDANSKENRYIVLLPRAEVIWDLLAESSVFLEMFRDDTYHCFSEKNAKLSTSLSSDSLFSAQAEFLSQIIEWEEKYIQGFLNNDIEFARNYFGESTISSHLLQGIKHSMKAYYKEQEASTALSNEIKQLQKKIDMLNKKYAGKYLVKTR